MPVQLFLRNTASDLGGAGQKSLSTSRGASSQTAVTTTTASGTNIQVTQTAGGQALTWFTDPLPAQSLSGTVDVNIRGRESATSVNAGAGILIERTNGAGVVQSTILSDRTVPASITEYSTTDAAKTSTGLSVTNTTINAGDRIKVTLKTRNAGTMAAGTTTNTYDGPTAAAAGDTYVTFSGLSITVPSTGLSGFSTTTAFTSANFIPAANSLIVAIGIAGNNTGSGTITAPITDSLGSTWTLLRRANGAGAGSAEVWAMDAGGSPATRTVTVTGTGGANAVGVALTILVLTGMNPVASVLGADNGVANTTANTISLTTTTVDSMVYGGYVNIVTSTGALTPNANTTALQSVLDTTRTEKYGTWSSVAPTVTPGATTYGYTNSAANNQAIVAVELLPADIEVEGTAALTIESTLSATATVTELATSALTIQSNLSATGNVTKLATSSLTVQSNLSATGNVIKPGSAALTIESNLSVTGSNRVVASNALTIQSNLVCSVLVTTLPTASLTVQSNLNSVGIASALGVSSLSVQSNLSVTGNVIKLGTVTLTAQSDLVVNGNVIGDNSVALTGQSDLAVTGIVTKIATATLTVQANLGAVANNTVMANTTFTIQSSLSGAGTNTVLPGSIVFNSQSTMDAEGVIGSLPITVTLTSQSALITNGYVTKFALAAFTVQSSLNSAALVTVNATVPFIVSSSLNSIGTIGQFAVASFTVQSGLEAEGFIPEVFQGDAAFTIQASLTVDGNASPPWVFTLIEFSDVSVQSYSGNSNNVITRESSARITSIEGG